MSDKPRPETPLDLQGYFCDILEMKPDELEKYFEFIDWPQSIGARFKKYLPHGFKDLADAVQGWGGQYDRDRRQFVLPKSTKGVGRKEAPPHSEKTTEISPGKEVPRFTFLPTDSILSMSFQSRVSVEDPEIADLAGSMQQHGILEPLLVRRKPSGNYELVAGHRRLHAAKKAGITQVPCIIREMSDQQAMEAHFIENLQRKDLSDYEKARMLDHLLQKFPEEYPTQEVLAFKIGKSKAWLSLHLKMLELEKVYPGKLPLQQITEHQAREILTAPEEKREEIIDHIKTTGEVPPVREIRKFVQPEAETTATSEITPEPAQLTGPIPLEPTGVDEKAEETEISETKPKSEAIDTGLVFECPECGFTATHIHYGPDKHTLQRVQARSSE